MGIFYPIASVAMSSKAGNALAWSYFKREWELFNKKFGDGAFLLARIVSYVTKEFTTEEQAKDVEQFFAAHDCPAAARTIKQSLESIRTRAAWLKRDAEAVNKFLSSH